MGPGQGSGAHCTVPGISYCRRMRGLGVALFCALLVGIAGCGDSEEPEPAVATGPFVGELSGTDAFVAVVAGKENVAAYVCDGGRGIAESFGGRRDGGRVTLTSERGAELSASIERGESSGTITLPGRPPMRFSAEPARGTAGLYQVPRARPVRAAWVVLNDGRQRGTFAGSRVNTSTGRAVVRDAGTLSVARVTPTQVSAAGFGGFNFFSGG